VHIKQNTKAVGVDTAVLFLQTSSERTDVIKKWYLQKMENKHIYMWLYMCSLPLRSDILSP